MAQLTPPYPGETPATIVTMDGRRLGVPRTMTVAEFMAFPWPDSERWELLEGVPVMSPSPAYRHQLLLGELHVFLHARLPDRDVMLGIDYSPPEHHSYVCPDLVVLEALGDADLPVECTPALAVEVLSPRNRSNDRRIKLALYATAGIPEYWIADPVRARLTIHILDVTGSERGYRKSRPDADGFAASPLLGVRLRVSKPGRRFVVEHRA